MRRIGSLAIVAVTLLVALPAWAEPQFYQTVDRNQVGLDDTFQLTIVATNAPRGARVQLPESDQFEILSKFQSTEQSFSFGSNGAQVDQTQKFTLVMRAKKTGTLIIPAARLVATDRSYQAEPVKITVRPGHLQDPNAYARRQQQMPDPMAAINQLQHMLDGDADQQDDSADDDSRPARNVQIPHSDSDLFLQSAIEPGSVYVGEQTTLSMYIYSRVDISSVDAMDMPKLDGFWSEDIESPNQLSGEQQLVDGVPYRVYLLRRKALFPVKPGRITIDPAQADITTGFLFAGRHVHRTGNSATLTVKPLPPGAPQGFSPANVGKWKLSAESSGDKVELGQPLTVRVTLEGVGNLKNVSPPRLQGPGAIKIYDPTTTDKVAVRAGKVGGKRVQEYLVLAQQTGTFTLPSLAFPYFDPQTGHYETARTEPITFTVVPGQGGNTSISTAPPATGSETGPKNVLAASGIRPLRYQAAFRAPAPPVWREPYFLPTVLGPFGAWAALGAFAFFRARSSRDEEGKRTKKLARAVRAHLEAADKLKTDPRPDAFWTELERALRHFLSLKLSTPVAGLTREALEQRLAEAGVSQASRDQIRRVLEACDVGRYAPGVDAGARDRAFDSAAGVIERWEDK